MSRPPLELVHDGDASTPFDALLEAAAKDPDAASGLVLAYAEMPREARAKLIEAIGEDGNALVLLLGVEEDPELAQALFEALFTLAPRVEARRDAAYGWGDVDEGGVALLRHLHGAFADGVRLSWGPGGIRAGSVPMARADDDALRRAAEIPPDARELPFEQGVDIASEALWRHRQRGAALPDELRRFAALFSPAPQHRADD